MTTDIIDTTMVADGSVSGTATVDGLYRVAATSASWSGTLAGTLTPSGHTRAVALTGISYTADAVEDTVRLKANDVFTLTLSGATSPSLKVTVSQVG